VVSGAADFGLSVATGSSLEEAGQGAGIGAAIGLVTFGLGKGVGRIRSKVASIKTGRHSGRGAIEAGKVWSKQSGFDSLPNEMKQTLIGYLDPKARAGLAQASKSMRDNVNKIRGLARQPSPIHKRVSIEAANAANLRRASIHNELLVSGNIGGDGALTRHRAIFPGSARNLVGNNLPLEIRLASNFNNYHLSHGLGGDSLAPSSWPYSRLYSDLEDSLFIFGG